MLQDKAHGEHGEHFALKPGYQLEKNALTIANFPSKALNVVVPGLRFVEDAR